MTKKFNGNKLNKDDLNLINFSLGKSTYKTIDEVESLSKEKIMILIEENLSNLIGYDKEKDDIDSLGEKADNVITKLLILLRKRGEM